ncbi:MAG: hypothetical protein J5953_13485 [Prevotella sp.]|nr:hypothetical protein [Prevotella sp.]
MGGASSNEQETKATRRKKLRRACHHPKQTGISENNSPHLDGKRGQKIAKYRRLFFLKASDDEVEKGNSHKDIYHIPHCPSKRNFEEWLKENRECCKEEAFAILLRFEAVIRKVSKGSGCSEAHQLIKTVWHISQTEQQ